MTETWLPIDGYEGIYEVSSEGRVRSLDRIDSRGWRRRGRVLQLAIHSKSGHLAVCLHDHGVGRTALVHRLVAHAFLGAPPPDRECCHNDGDPTNNNVANLRWGTRSDNMHDRVQHGTHHARRKTRCKRGHPLTEPNLVPSTSRRGWRGCLACRRATNESNKKGIPMTQELADSHFARIAH